MLGALRLHQNINIFKNFLGGNVQRSLRRLDEIVAGSATMLASEKIYKDHGFVKLLGPN